jgi:hypothetical protein
MLRARMRAPFGWTDACILNVSSRGLLINASTAGAAAAGTKVELWHGEQVIVAEVVWRKGTRAGLRTDERVPVEEIMALSKAPALQLTAGEWPLQDRRKRPRSHEENRLRSRAIEFAGTVAIAACLAVGAFAMVEQAFARPLAVVERALAG